MFKMSSNIPEKNEKSGRQQKALEALLEMVQGWQGKRTSVEEAKESIQRLQGQMHAKFGDEIDPLKINLQGLLALFAKPGHFNEAEKKLVQALFSEAAKLKKKFDGGEGRSGVLAKNKNRFKKPVEKKYI